MFILFSPSEEKIKSSNNYNIEFIKNFFINFDTSQLSIKSNFRNNFLKEYAKNFNNLENIFGVKNTNDVFKNFSTNLYSAINLYQGISFKELSYNNLSDKSKDYINRHLIIFSNLFGPIRPNDKIPFYKLKQGIKINNINQAKSYKEDTSKQLDELINDFVIDLRAKIYEEYYDIKTNYVNFNFIKNGKQLSHSSKIYRAKILKVLANNNVTELKELFNIINNNFNVSSIKTLDNKTIFNINVKD